MEFMFRFLVFGSDLLQFNLKLVGRFLSTSMGAFQKAMLSNVLFLQRDLKAEVLSLRQVLGGEQWGARLPFFSENEKVLHVCLYFPCEMRKEATGEPSSVS